MVRSRHPTFRTTSRLRNYVLWLGSLLIFLPKVAEGKADEYKKAQDELHGTVLIFATTTLTFDPCHRKLAHALGHSHNCLCKQGQAPEELGNRVHKTAVVRVAKPAVHHGQQGESIEFRTRRAYKTHVHRRASISMATHGQCAYQRQLRLQHQEHCSKREASVVGTWGTHKG